jgi:hypothetical protein
MPSIWLGAGAGIALTVWLSPSPAPLWPFADHMVRHMAVVAIAAPLIAQEPEACC